MNHLESLTKKIHKHCPELLELSFGCEVKLKRNLHTRFKGEVGMLGGTADCYQIVFENGHWIMTEDGEDDFQTLGHPIELQHVLRAIGKEKEHHANEFHIDIRGYFRNNQGFSKGSFMGHWDLTKPLSGQSEECLKFLDEIIK